MITKRAKHKLLLNFDDIVKEELRNWKVAREYLRQALQEGGLDEFLETLREIAKAVGISRLAKRSGLSRQTIYKIISDKGNPQARSLWKMMEALNMRFDLVLDEHHKKAA